MWRVAAILFLGWVAGAAPAAAPIRPNILFIFTDDQSYKTVGCYPESPRWVRTPNLDRLAQRGVRFERAYHGAWCMPSRAVFLTGRLPHAIESMRMESEYPGSTYNPAKCPFWPATFRNQGYHTAQIGKWHTGVDTGWGRDWDYQVVWNRPGLPKNAGAYYRNQLLAINGKLAQQPEPTYSTDHYTQLAVDYLKRRAESPKQPWYLWLCYGAIHGPTTPADRHRGSYRDGDITVPADVFGPRPNKPAYLEQTQAWVRDAQGRPVLKGKPKRPGNFDQDEAGLPLRSWIQQMNECAQAIDDGVGRLIATLRETGQIDNTLIVFTSDQGYAMGEHGLNIKLAPYDAAYASPLIVSRPGVVPEGKVCARPVNSADLVATFFGTAGIEPTWKLHGRDLTPLLLDPTRRDWNHPTLMTFTGASYGSDTHRLPTGNAAIYHGVPWWVMLRDGPYKYIRYLIPGETEEVYDLRTDPEELRNLAHEPKERDHLERLRKLAFAELRRTDAGFVDRMPPVK